MILSHNNVASIVVSSQATAREIFAAEELSKYIERILGIRYPIVDDGHAVTKQQIVIGGPVRNRVAALLIDTCEFQNLVPGLEGFLIKSFGEDKVLIAGSEDSSERGTVYATYEFLERFLGCSLSAYSHPEIAAGEWVPNADVIKLDSINYIKKNADCPIRGAVVQYDASAGNVNRVLNITFYEWLLKNRYNYVYLWMQTYAQLQELGIIAEITDRGLSLMVGHHDAQDMFLPADGNEMFPEKYYETNPEYFRLNEDGTRFRPGGHYGQMSLCKRNEEMIDTYSENILKWCHINPGVKIINPAPRDGCAPQCCCEKCRPYSKIENYTFFCSEIAKRVQRVRPDVMISQLAYVDLWEPPKGLELTEKNMVIEATWADELRTAGKADGTSLIGTDFEENLLNWKKTGASVAFYDYYMGVYPARQRWIPMADEIQPIFANFVKKGIKGSFTQIECFNLWNNIFNFYTFGRTAFDVSLSMENNLEVFSRIFGGGAEYIKKIIRMAEECLDGQETIMTAALYMIDHIDKTTVYQQFDEALANAGSALARNNTRLLRMVFRYGDLESQQENARYIQQGEEYQIVRPFPNIDQELLYMTEFDSFWKNDPGYGIAIPVTGEKRGAEFDSKADVWYSFE